MERFAEYVNDNWDELYQLAYLLAGRSVSADDLLQEALVKAMRSWPRMQAATSRRAYFRKILATTAIDISKDVQRRAGQALQGADASDDHWESSVLDRSHLWPLIATLPPRQRAIVVLRYYEDLSERQIADALGCRPGTVKSQASAALRRLAGELSGVAEGTR